MNALAPIIRPAEQHNLLFRPAKGRRDLPCWIAAPVAGTSKAPPLVAVHGINREAMTQASLFKTAIGTDRTVIAPCFSPEIWPRYQLAVKKGRADKALIRLIDSLQSDGLLSGPSFELFGFSGGAQFAHRFAMMHPERVQRLMVSSAGWYTFPDQTRFPYGIENFVSEENLKRFLQIPIDIYVGADDTVVDKNTRNTPQVNAQQGINRAERAVRWAQALRRNAAKLYGIKADVRFSALSGCGHDFEECFNKGRLGRRIASTHAETPYHYTSADVAV
ncbi:alpha/beta fold hydrolase [Pseudaestuariivita rosea]|uniref:alpha/beta fold hydrolase n=1 Tax=Pseudaestuariivita rosea TaxID=2763263 RepID=UPI001ABB71A8|nr:hypothetical protein [Pseudaestuariivita rosea]